MHTYWLHSATNAMFGIDIKAELVLIINQTTLEYTTRQDLEPPFFITVKDLALAFNNMLHHVNTMSTKSIAG